MKKIVIVGGGASGMMAAIAAAKENPAAQIRILERKDLPGKKILSTGNGRCNFTNQVMNANCFFSDTPNGIEEVLQQFGTTETLDVFSDLGILPKDRNGYYYPRSDQASSIVSVLRTRLQQAGVEVETNVYVTGLKKTKKGFLISTDGKTYEADAVILACGGKAAPALGSDGSGYDLAKSMGHHMVPVVPALVQLKVDRFALKAAAGVRTDAEVSFYEDGTYIAKDRGEVQITAYGLSGIPIFQISRCAAKALYYHKNAVVHLDLIPQMEDGIALCAAVAHGSHAGAQLCLGRRSHALGRGTRHHLRRGRERRQRSSGPVRHDDPRAGGRGHRALHGTSGGAGQKIKR